MVVDTHVRFTVDDRRLYAAGHSGGAMAALEWARNGKLAGVVACSSTHPAPGLPQQGFRVFAAAGVDDFAYYNMHQLSREFAKSGIESRFYEFPAGHEWLPAEAADEALQFFSGTLPPAPAPDSKEVRNLAARFEQMSSQLFRVEETERYSLVRLYTKEAAKPANTPDRRLARQLLASTYIAYAEDARERMANKEYATAARCWETNVQMRPENAVAWYSLAVASAAAGNKRRALEALEKAAANGYRDAARMEREPLLNAVRRDKRYRAVLDSLSRN
jgi:tetratricopeptide (TPR) repeat protein